MARLEALAASSRQQKEEAEKSSHESQPQVKKSKEESKASSKVDKQSLPSEQPKYERSSGTEKEGSRQVPVPGPSEKVAESVENMVKRSPSVASERNEELSKEKKEERFSKWLADELEIIFQATLDSSQKANGLIFLKGVSSELESEKKLLSADYLEMVFMEILTDAGFPAFYGTPIDYLLQVYEKAFQQKRIISKKDPLYELKLATVNLISRYCTSYGFICFQVPDMFLRNDVRLSIDTLINNSELGIFLNEIVQNAQEQDSLIDLLNILLPSISSRLISLNLNDTAYSKCLSILETLVGNKSVAAVVTQVEGFQPPDDNNCLDYEHKTLIGPILRLSPLLESTSIYYFTENAGSLSNVQLNSTNESLQNEYRVVLDRLFFIVDKIIRGSTQSRNDLLSWFAKLINLSHLRRGSHADFSKLPSDGIMFNIAMILIKLSLPFLEHPTYSKIDRINPYFFSNNRFLDVSEETRINSSIHEANQYFQKHESSEPLNFITECFFLTLAYLHYGINGVFNHHDRLKDQIKQFSSRIEMLDNNQVPTGMNPMMSALLRHQLPTLKKSFNGLSALKHSIQAVFSFRLLQLDVFDFIIGATTFLTRVLDPSHQHPQKKIVIPLFKASAVSQLDDQDFLRSQSPEPWKLYPEFVLEGVITYCKSIANFRGCPLIQNHQKLEQFVEFSTILLRCPELVGNPHMKAHLVEILFIGSLPMINGSEGFIASILSSNKLVVDNILYALLDIYVMIEKTGASSQFYDKFNTRYYISVILEELWKHDVYREQLTYYSTDNVDFFVRFIARMLNDTTYLLDETFIELNLIHDYQVETKKRTRGLPAQTDEYGNDEELGNNLSMSERKARTYVSLSNKTMELFKLFTKQTPGGFALREIVDRLAGMLDYNLSVMVGPKCSNLKVEDPKKYEFDPRKTLSDLYQVYYNLINEESFLVAVARDGRSFNIKYFQKAKQILTTKTFTDARVIQKVMEFAEKAENQRLADENEEVELGEIPDEFLDPLMFLLMEDPVILPASKVSIDRSTIKAHLLSDPSDPFNRMPLKLEDVTEDVELKRKISEFKENAKKRAKEEKSRDVHMSDA